MSNFYHDPNYESIVKQQLENQTKSLDDIKRNLEGYGNNSDRSFFQYLRETWNITPFGFICRLALLGFLSTAAIMLCKYAKIDKNEFGYIVSLVTVWTIVHIIRKTFVFLFQLFNKDKHGLQLFLKKELIYYALIITMTVVLSLLCKDNVFKYYLYLIYAIPEMMGVFL